MIEYYEQLLQEEQEAITEIIQTLFRQTFILEQKFDRRAGRLQYEKDYRVCTRHFEFLKAYFAISGIQLCENVHMGIIYIQGETLWGEFRVLKGLPSPTEMKRTIAMLKKYQIVEPLDSLEELNEATRVVIYPSIHAVLLGDDIRELLTTFEEAKELKSQQSVFHKEVESEEEHRGETTAI